MMGITDTTIQLIRESLSSGVEGEFVPIKQMVGYYVARTKVESAPYTYLFSVDIDEKEVFIYANL